MKFNDLAAEHALFKPYIDKEWASIAQSGHYLLGQQTTRLENNFVKLTGMRHAIAVKNATDAISLILQTVWRTGMKVIIPNFGAYPTAIAAARIAGTDNIHFVDVDKTFCIDVNKLPDIKNGIIIPVNLFGNNARLEEISKYARLNNHIVITDCAQSTGSTFSIQHDEKALDDFKVFSFYPTKPLASMGDGGMICANNPEWAEKIRELRFYGNKQGVIMEVGINSRMDEWQAAVVNAKMDNPTTFFDLVTIRNKIANRYKEIIEGMPEHYFCAWHQFPVLFNDRGNIVAQLILRQIPCMVHYPFHVSDHPVFNLNKTDKVGFRVSNKIISLPVHAFMKEEEIEQVEHFLSDYKTHEYIPA